LLIEGVAERMLTRAFANGERVTLHLLSVPALLFSLLLGEAVSCCNVRVRRASGTGSSAAVKSATADDDDHWEIVVPVTRVGIAPTV